MYVVLVSERSKKLAATSLPVFLILIFAPMVGFGIFVLPKLR